MILKFLTTPRTLAVIGTIVSVIASGFYIYYSTKNSATARCEAEILRTETEYRRRLSDINRRILEEQDMVVKRLERENANLKNRIRRLDAILDSLDDRKAGPAIREALKILRTTPEISPDR